jgi:hypothetical protein
VWRWKNSEQGAKKEPKNNGTTFPKVVSQIARFGTFGDFVFVDRLLGGVRPADQDEEKYRLFTASY